MQRLFRSGEGFSLVEVVVAIFILIIGILGILPLLALNVKSNTGARYLGVANYLAQQKLEIIKSWPYYDDQVINGATVKGVVADNPTLFGDEDDVTLPRPKVTNVGVAFKRYTELIHNGYSGNYDCDSGSQGFFFGNYAGSQGLDEGEFNNPAAPSVNLTLNTDQVNPCSGGFYRGEDFKVVRVRVEWSDVFGPHSVVRHMYIARY